MLRTIRRVQAHRRDADEGASAVEYGLLVAAIAAVIVIIIFALGGVIKNVFEKTCGSIQTGAGTTSSCT
jgi:pilus assembly protein Flp/PilA